MNFKELLRSMGCLKVWLDHPSSPTVLKFTHYNRLQGLKLPRQTVDVDDKKCQN